jgi:hypothetical protein
VAITFVSGIDCHHSPVACCAHPLQPADFTFMGVPLVSRFCQLQMNAPQECASVSVACASPSKTHSTLSPSMPLPTPPENALSVSPSPQLVGYAFVIIVFLLPKLSSPNHTEWPPPPLSIQPNLPQLSLVPNKMQGPAALAIIPSHQGASSLSCQQSRSPPTAPSSILVCDYCTKAFRHHCQSAPARWGCLPY